LVCTNCLRSLVYAGRHFRLLRIPYVCHVRDCLQAWFEHRNLALLNHARRIITNSEAITAVCREEGVKAGLIRTVYNPIDIERLRNLSIDTKHQFHVTNDVPYDAFVFGLPGRIEEIKGQTDFIGAAAIVAKHVSNAHFLIIGDTGDHEYLALLKQRVQIHNLDRVVHFVEFQHDIAAIMSSVDVVVVPSQLRPAVTTPIPPGSVGKQVGFGRVVVEAMAAGRPVIAAGIDGISEVVEHERNGLIVPPGDIDALACAMSRLVQDSRLFVQLRKNGLDTARRFTPERHANQIQAIYDDILNL
jgi:glycosyltransferase involved in cell wall biosynthesis